MSLRIFVDPFPCLGELEVLKLRIKWSLAVAVVQLRWGRDSGGAPVKVLRPTNGKSPFSCRTIAYALFALCKCACKVWSTSSEPQPCKLQHTVQSPSTVLLGT